MAWTQQDVDTLKAAIATGVLSVRYDSPGGGGRLITYQSTSAMLEALGHMAAEVAAANGRKPYTLAGFRKGV